MKKLAGIIFVVFLATLTLAPRTRADDRGGDLHRIRESRAVLQELMQTPDKSIPTDLLESAKCIAVIPTDIKGAFIVGAQYGRGLAMCRTREGWSAPVFVTMAGGSFGLQIGGAATDLVLVFRNREGLQRLLSDKFKIGADATAAAGPVGRNTSAATDIEMRAEILTYSRSRGVFAGISLNGTVVAPDRSANEALYGKNVDREAILRGRVQVPEVAQRLVAEVERYTA
jgi:SH3 domain-containing YSC84-like protein 1